MDDNVAIIMHNTVCVVAFVLLAIAFKYWWLVFFALIFFHPIQSKDDKQEKDTDENGGKEMNYFRCCLDCVAPKRYPGCSGKCAEYLSEKARYDSDKEKANKIDRGVTGNYFMERRIESRDRYVKYKQKKRGRKGYPFGEKH